MDASDVLKHFLELFNNDSAQLQLVIAPNGVVDWFGRTVRGPAKIHDFLRYEVNTQYVHANFESPAACDAIEQKPAHKKTKCLPCDIVDYVRPKNKVTGLSSLKTYADSDIEDDELELQPLPDLKTPIKEDNASFAGELTPPSSTIKIQQHGSDSDTNNSDDDCEGGSTAKRVRRTHPTPFSYLRRLPMKSPTPKATKKHYTEDYDMHMLGADTSSDEEEDSMHAKLEYTPLAYIQATGILQQKPTAVDATPMSGSSDRNWDRKVRVRLSYRQRLSGKQELQFVLIIYEHLNQPVTRTPTKRRNLMAQFNAAKEEEIESSVAVAPQQAMHTEEELHEELQAAAAATTDVTELIETPAFTVPVLRTPTKSLQTPPATPKRKPRLSYAMSGLKQLNSTPSSSKRSAARTLRL